MIRVLAPGDEEALEAFLTRHAATSMFLRSNVAEAGLRDEGLRFQATYAAAFDGREITSVAAHCWNGLMLLQAPARLDEAVREAVAQSGRDVKGFLGPWDQVEAARRATGTDGRTAQRESPEDLFELRLDELRVPAPLAEERVAVRRVEERDLEDYVALQVEYEIEALGAEPGPRLEEREREEARRSMQAGTAFVALLDGRVAATANFNARLPDCVQIGGVYSPPALRGRGLARSVVVGALLTARGEGVALSILFTDRGNEPARRAYLALGYRIIGDYGIVLL